MGGKRVPFTQAGGIVAVSPGKRPLKFKVSYEGTNVMPGFDRLFSEEMLKGGYRKKYFRAISRLTALARDAKGLVPAH